MVSTRSSTAKLPNPNATTPQASRLEYPRSKPEFTSSVQRNGVAWDVAQSREVLPMSSQDFEAVGDAEESRSTHKCICGTEIEVPSSSSLVLASTRMTASQRELARQPRPVFNEDVGAFEVPKLPAISKPFARLDVSAATDFSDPRKKKSTILAPAGYTVEQYLADNYKSPPLSYERTVPQCPHYPITEELLEENIIFKKGDRWTTDDFGRDVDQARYLCLIAHDRRVDKRRMSIHAPPEDWVNIDQVSTLNRWKAQFRVRKLGIKTREYREPWSQEQLQFLLEYLVDNDAKYQRDDLAELVNEKFGIDRNGHSVTCAIDNHKLRDKANEELGHRKKVEANAAAGAVAAVEQDQEMGDGQDEVHVKKEEVEHNTAAEILADYGWAEGDDTDTSA